MNYPHLSLFVKRVTHSQSQVALALSWCEDTTKFPNCQTFISQYNVAKQAGDFASHDKNTNKMALFGAPMSLTVTVEIQNDPFRSVIRPISQCEMGRFSS